MSDITRVYLRLRAQGNWTPAAAWAAACTGLSIAEIDEFERKAVQP